MLIDTISWQGPLQRGWVELIDQTQLPGHTEKLQITTVEQMWNAIRRLQIRGAPAIGIAAAFGIVLGIRHAENDKDELFSALQKVGDYLKTSRPTAVNLFWAIERMHGTAQKLRQQSAAQILERLWREAQNILDEDRHICQQLGKNGVSLLAPKSTVLTHCNAGGLATSGHGTALAVLYEAKQQGNELHVYVDETRPLLQGARLTTWELLQAQIPVTLICDNTAAFAMQQRKIDIVIVGADRIAANGDTANKIGTYGLAALASIHNIPFYVVAPSSTFDFTLANGQQIPVEERSKDEVTHIAGIAIAPQEVASYTPAFDITPAQYITGIVTEYGVLSAPYEKTIEQMRGRMDESGG